MSNYPEYTDIFVELDGTNDILSSDPNNAYAGIEAIQGLIGALGKPQSWSVTLLTLLRQYRAGMKIYIDTGVPVITVGEVVLENTNASKYVFRRNTSEITISAADLDVGSLVVATYYLFATGKTAASTAPLMFSTDSLAPSGIGTAPYKKLGHFWNTQVGVLSVTNYTNEDSSVSPIPSGMISLWNGQVADIPGDWAICNGSNGTPDLQDRFVVGFGVKADLLSTGGDAFATSYPLGAETQTSPYINAYGSGGNTNVGPHTHKYMLPYYVLAYIMKL